MAHTYPNILVHCVFSTKERRDTIPEALREKLARYFIGIGKNHEVPVSAREGPPIMRIC